MPEKFSPQPTPENKNIDDLLKELNSKKIRDTVSHFIFSLKMKISPAEAEDIVQQTMLKAIKAIKDDRFKAGHELKHWLFVIAKNTARDLLRRKKFTDTTSLSDIPEMANEEQTSEEKYLKAEEIKNLRSHFNKLPPKLEKLMILLSTGLSLKEIAKHWGTTHGALQQHYWKATQLLKESMKDEHQK